MRVFKEVTVLDAKAATGIGTNVDVSQHRHLVLMVGTASSADLTCKFQGSVLETVPDFSTAQTVANHWDYVQVVDLQSGSGIAGDTGFVVTGTDDFRLFEVNVNGLKWFNARVTARSAGSVTVKIMAFND